MGLTSFGRSTLRRLSRVVQRLLEYSLAFSWSRKRVWRSALGSQHSVFEIDVLPRREHAIPHLSQEPRLQALKLVRTWEERLVSIKGLVRR